MSDTPKSAPPLPAGGRYCEMHDAVYFRFCAACAMPKMPPVVRLELPAARLLLRVLELVELSDVEEVAALKLFEQRVLEAESRS